MLPPPSSATSPFTDPAEPFSPNGGATREELRLDGSSPKTSESLLPDEIFRSAALVVDPRLDDLRRDRVLPTSERAASPACTSVPPLRVLPACPPGSLIAEQEHSPHKRVVRDFMRGGVPRRMTSLPILPKQILNRGYHLLFWVFQSWLYLVLFFLLRRLEDARCTTNTRSACSAAVSCAGTVLGPLKQGEPCTYSNIWRRIFCLLMSRNTTILRLDYTHKVVLLIAGGLNRVVIE